MEAVRPAAQHHGVAALQAQRPGVGGDVGSALVNDSDDAERRGDPLDDEAVRPGEGRERPADRIGQAGHRLQAAGHRLDPGSVEREAVEERWRQALRLAVGDVARVGSENVAGLLAQDARRRCQRPVLLCGRRVGERAGRALRFRADGAHCGSNVDF